MYEKMPYIKKAILESANSPSGIYQRVIGLEKSLAEFNRRLNGDELRSRYEGAAPTSVKTRVDLISGALWSTTSAPTTTFIKSYEAAAAKCDDLLNELKT
jgi:hypothetical protein